MPTHTTRITYVEIPVFDIDLKLERSIFGSDKLEDITAEDEIPWDTNLEIEEENDED